MKQIIFIKNMVCNRCESVLQQEFEKLKIKVYRIELGMVVVELDGEETMRFIEQIIKQNGFEIIKEDGDILVEKVKTLLIDALHQENRLKMSNSEFLSQQLHRDYSVISKLFSNRVGITIEKYFINLKIEKAKELIQMGDLSFSEIGYSLDYKNSSHLSKQFKTIVGISMSTYKEEQIWNRKTFDQIV